MFSVKFIAVLKNKWLKVDCFTIGILSICTFNTGKTMEMYTLVIFKRYFLDFFVIYVVLVTCKQH